MIKAIKVNDYTTASAEMKDSRLYREYKTRVNRLRHKLNGGI